MTKVAQQRGFHVRLAASDVRRVDRLARRVHITPTEQVRVAARLGMTVLECAHWEDGVARQRALMARFDPKARRTD